MTINVNNASYRYPGRDDVLKDISFSVPSGSLTAILGPNGAGKTTLLRCLTGFLRWTSGYADIDGERISSMPPKKLWSLISYVPQAKSVSPGFTVEETVLLGRSGQSGLKPSERDIKAAEDALSRLGISRLANRRCGELSGGELQMALIARAIAAEPKAVILDEPESNLDFRNQLIILDTLSSLAKSGMAVIFNTHYPAHALQRAEKSLLLRRGGEAVFGDTEEIITEENIASAFGVEARLSCDGGVKTVTAVRILGDGE